MQAWWIYINTEQKGHKKQDRGCQWIEMGIRTNTHKSPVLMLSVTKDSWEALQVISDEGMDRDNITGLVLGAQDEDITLINSH